MDLGEAMKIAADRSRGLKPKPNLVDLSDEAVMIKVREKLAELRTAVGWATSMGISIRWEIMEKDTTAHPKKDQQVSFPMPRIREAVIKV